MNLNPQDCYQAFQAHDRRFDGWFYIGVSSTGIYCRPVCTVRLPQFKNCTFYPSAASAEQAGFRPCLKCRPELAPGYGLPDMSGNLARTAASMIEAGFLASENIETLARRIGVTARHLRRIFEIEFGVTLVAYAQTQKLLLAKRLLTDSPLPIGQVALVAGFGSIRRFNDVFRSRYRLTPQALRGDKTERHVPDLVRCEIGYRPPFAWEYLLAFFRSRQIPGVEHIDATSYSRCITVRHGTQTLRGVIRIGHNPLRHTLIVDMPLGMSTATALILAKIRHLFDTDCRPDLIDTHLGMLAADLPGMRVPGTVDGFEIAVRAFAGQQITVQGARTILGRIAASFGTRLDLPDSPVALTFPAAEKLADTDPQALTETGLIRSRAEAIIALAKKVTSGELQLTPTTQLSVLENTLQQIQSVHGIGAWTAQYIAMRALAWPNAFPEGDIILRKQTGAQSTRELNQIASQWAPWRAYATLHLWRHFDLEKQRLADQKKTLGAS